MKVFSIKRLEFQNLFSVFLVNMYNQQQRINFAFAFNDLIVFFFKNETEQNNLSQSFMNSATYTALCKLLTMIYQRLQVFFSDSVLSIIYFKLLQLL